MESQPETMKVALVHEWLINFRGSEKVLLELARMFPDAVIYASVLRRSELPGELADRNIRTTFIQRLPWAHRLYQKYLFLMPLAYARLDMSQYDLVITSSHACANGVRPRRGAMHVSYCYTPMRYAWSGYEDYRNSLRSPIARVIMSVMMRWMRRWDYAAAQRVTRYIACSSAVSDRIKTGLLTPCRHTDEDRHSFRRTDSRGGCAGHRTPGTDKLSRRSIRQHASQFSPAAFRSAILKSIQTIMRGDRQL